MDDGKKPIGQRISDACDARGWSHEELAERAGMHKNTVSLAIRGKGGSVDTYASLASALGMRLTVIPQTLEALAGVAFPKDTHDEGERIQHVARKPRRVDKATVESLASILAGQRRIEDRMGSSFVLGPVTAQTRIVEHLIGEAPDNDLRRSLIDVGSQWAQFAGWLTETTAHYRDSLSWYTKAMEWAGEADNPDLFATAISMRGHLAWVQDQTHAMIRLSRAASWQPACLSVRANALQQEARGLALLGDAKTTDERLNEAEEFAVAAEHHPSGEQDWMYFYDSAYFTMQRGLADLYLGRYERAITLLIAGLARIPEEIRKSDWVAWYVLRLGEAYAKLREFDAARRTIQEARRVAVATGADRLTAEIDATVMSLNL